MRLIKNYSLKWIIKKIRCPKCNNIFLSLKILSGKNLPNYGIDANSWFGMQCNSCKKFAICNIDCDAIYFKLIKVMKEIQPPGDYPRGHIYIWGTSKWAPEKNHIFELSVDDCPCGGKFKILSDEYCSFCKTMIREISRSGIREYEVPREKSGKIWGKPHIITHLKLLEIEPPHPILKQILDDKTKMNIKNYKDIYIKNDCPKKWFLK